MACNQGFSEHLKLLEKGLKSAFPAVAWNTDKWTIT